MKRKIIHILPFIFFIHLFFVPLISSGEEQKNDSVTIVAVMSRDIVPYNMALEGFSDVLKEGGLSVEFIKHDLGGDIEGGEEMINGIRSSKPTLILAIGSEAATFSKENFGNIPVVFAMVLNPVESNLVNSMTSSGNNLTGASLDIPITSQFEQIKNVIKGVSKIGVIYNPDENQDLIAKAITIADDLGMKLIGLPIASESDIPKKVGGFLKKVDILWSVVDSVVLSPESAKYILLQSMRSGVPLWGLSPGYVKAGALLSVSLDYKDIGRQAGEVALKVLEGKKPHEIPITSPRKTFLWLNLKTAKLIDLAISSDVVQRAANVIR